MILEYQVQLKGKCKGGFQQHQLRQPPPSVATSWQPAVAGSGSSSTTTTTTFYQQLQLPATPAAHCCAPGPYTTHIGRFCPPLFLFTSYYYHALLLLLLLLVLLASKQVVPIPTAKNTTTTTRAAPDQRPRKVGLQDYSQRRKNSATMFSLNISSCINSYETNDISLYSPN